MAVQLKTAEDDKVSLQQALKSEIESRMQLEGKVWTMYIVSLGIYQFMWSGDKEWERQGLCDTIFACPSCNDTDEMAKHLFF